MDLLPRRWRRNLPSLLDQRNSKDPIVYLRFVAQDLGVAWYVTEGSSRYDDFVFFGYVVGAECEWRHFTLSELTSGTLRTSALVRRDASFTPKPFSVLRH
jgi:hypothetical protein